MFEFSKVDSRLWVNYLRKQAVPLLRQRVGRIRAELTIDPSLSMPAALQKARDLLGAKVDGGLLIQALQLVELIGVPA